MGCLSVSTLDAYVSGQLGTGDRLAAQHHASDCASCRDAATTAGLVGDDAPLDFQVGRHRVLGVLGSGGMGVVLAAHDPQLDRRVALKILRGEPDASSRARLLREAQAMARLVHPGVITIFDVGETDDGEIYLAMELVEGGTLRTWLAAGPRTWREIVAMFATAGGGLAAAHAAGVIHRDFKPDNVLIGADGRARVTDFGLACADTTTRSGETGLLDLDLTVTGQVVGTPAYMSAEQFSARPCDERSDQFSFCVALFEALWKQRPFAGTTARELAASVTKGQIVDAPLAGVPAPIRRAIVRGLAVAPAERWPSMAALLDELTRDRARRRRRIATAAVAAAAVAALGATAVHGTGDGPCAAAPERVWTAAERSRVQAAFAATGAEDQAAAFERVAVLFDGQRDRWRTAHHAVCEDTHVRGTASPAMLDLRMACLAGVDDRTRSLVAALATAQATTVAMAPAVVAALPDADACRDVQRFVELTPPPADPRLPAVRARVATAATDLALGNVSAAHGAAVEAATSAAAIGWQPLRAEALLLAARTATEPARSLVLYREALDAAEAGRDDTQRATAWMAMARDAALSSRLDALDLYLTMGTAAARRAGDQATVRRTTLERGVALATAGRIVEGQPLVRQACAETIDRDGASAADALRCRIELARIAAYTDSADPGEALALAADLERAYGAATPERSDVLLLAAAAQTRAKDLDGAERSLREVVAMRRRAYGDDSLPVANALLNLGELYGQRGDLPRARDMLEHGLATQERINGVDSSSALIAHLMLASIEASAGEIAAALTRLRSHLPRFEAALGTGIAELAYARQLEAGLLVASGEPAAALPLFRRAIDQSSTIYGATSPQVRQLQLEAASARLATGAAAEAAAELEALIGDLDGTDRAGAELTLASALWRSGKRPRAIAAASRARDAFAVAGDGFATQRAAAEAWLAHPR